LPDEDASLVDTSDEDGARGVLVNGAPVLSVVGEDARALVKGGPRANFGNVHPRLWLKSAAAANADISTCCLRGLVARSSSVTPVICTVAVTDRVGESGCVVGSDVDTGMGAGVDADIDTG
jgi:hypothetical protein